jgi:signal transduction histidine kinase
MADEYVHRPMNRPGSRVESFGFLRSRPWRSPGDPRLRQGGVAAFGVATIVAVCALLGYSVAGGAPDPWTWAFIAAIVATDMTELPIVTGSGEYKVLLNDVLVLVAFAWFPSHDVALLLALVTATSWVLMPLSWSMRLAHSSSGLLYRSVLWAAAATVLASGGTSYAAVLAMVAVGIAYDFTVFWPVAHMLIAERRRTWAQFVRTALPIQAVIAAAYLPLALAGVAAMDAAPWSVPLLAFPILVSWRLALLDANVRELAASDRMKSRFISMASHELQTPLTSIVGFSATLEDRWDELDERQRRSFLRIVHDQGVRLSRLVSQMLVLSRLDAGPDVVSEPVDVSRAVAQAVRDSGVPLDDVELDVDADLVVRATEDDLVRIVINLMSNAGKYGRPPIRVHAYRDSARWITIEVIDGGDGVAPLDQPRVFDHFARGADVPSNVAGSGLGLAIARQVARQHGGDLYYDDAAAAGACFAVRLRRVDGSTARATSTPETGSSASRRTASSVPSGTSSGSSGSTRGE